MINPWIRRQIEANEALKRLHPNPGYEELRRLQEERDARIREVKKRLERVTVMAEESRRWQKR